MIPLVRVPPGRSFEEKAFGVFQDLKEEIASFQWMNLRSHILNWYPVLPCVREKEKGERL